MPITIDGVEYIDVFEAAALVGRGVETIRWYMKHPNEGERLRPVRFYGNAGLFDAATVSAFFANLRPPKGKAPKTPWGYYSANEVARALKVPVAEIRRRLKTGELVAERTDEDGRALVSKKTLDGLRRAAGLLDDAKQDGGETE